MITEMIWAISSVRHEIVDHPTTPTIRQCWCRGNPARLLMKKYVFELLCVTPRPPNERTDTRSLACPSCFLNSVRHLRLDVRWRPCFTELHHHRGHYRLSDLCAVLRSFTMSTSQTCRRGFPAVYVADESHGDKPIWSM
jgi:hypothetical protein